MTTPVRQCVIPVGATTMQQVGDRPFLAWLLREASRWGIEEAVLLGTPAPLDTPALPKPMRIIAATTLHQAAPLLHDRFLLLDGHSFLDAPLGRLLAPPPDQTAPAHLLLHPAKSPPAGLAVLDRRILPHLEHTPNHGLFPTLTTTPGIHLQPSEAWSIDLDQPGALARARQQLPPRLHRRALFLDRDGVLNIDHGWVGTRERFEWMPGALDAIAQATHLGWHVFVVTNQSGVARGHYTEADVQFLMTWIRDQALAAGGTIDDMRYCPHHPEAALPEYRLVSNWRKPAPGMIQDLLETWSLTPGTCLLIGDQPTDLAAAAAANVPAHLFPGPNLATFITPLLNTDPTPTAPSPIGKGPG